MATTKLTIKYRSENTRKDGNVSIIFELYHNRQRSRISTDIVVSPDDFDLNEGRILPSHPQAKELNAQLECLQNDYQSLFDEFDLTRIKKATELKKMLVARLNKKKSKNNHTAKESKVRRIETEDDIDRLIPIPQLSTYAKRKQTSERRKRDAENMYALLKQYAHNDAKPTTWKAFIGRTIKEVPIEKGQYFWRIWDLRNEYNHKFCTSYSNTKTENILHRLAGEKCVSGRYAKVTLDLCKSDSESYAKVTLKTIKGAGYLVTIKELYNPTSYKHNECVTNDTNLCKSDSESYAKVTLDLCKSDYYNKYYIINIKKNNRESREFRFSKMMIGEYPKVASMSTPLTLEQYDELVKLSGNYDIVRMHLNTLNAYKEITIPSVYHYILNKINEQSKN